MIIAIENTKGETIGAVQLIETDDGIKIPIYESYSSFSDGTKIGDRVRFEVEKVEGSGYKIIGIAIE